ncbi:hypothetical protein MP638_001394 [Amoeboaphelidium occidentale]|nr:hypothetical protein MP638_001394 [Amoeboaphelidium occidentale]
MEYNTTLSRRPSTHEDSLISYARSLWQSSWKHDNDFSGYLSKLTTGSYKRWIKRYYILKKDAIFYFKSSNDSVPLGVLFIDGTCKVSLDVVDEKAGIRVKVASSCSFEALKTFERREYLLLCSDVTDAKLWVSAIEHVVEEYYSGTSEQERNELKVKSTKQLEPLPILPPAPPPPLPMVAAAPAAKTNEAKPLRKSRSDSTKSLTGTETQSLYTVYMLARQKISECVKLIVAYAADSDDAPPVNYVELVTVVIKHVRQLLYYVDSNSTKTMDNGDLCTFMSKQQSLIIDRCKVIGIQAKHITDEECLGFKRPGLARELAVLLEGLQKELNVFVSLAKSLGIIDEILSKCDDLTEDISPVITTCILDVLHHILSASSFIQSMNASESLSFVKKLCNFGKELLSNYEKCVTVSDNRTCSVHLDELYANHKLYSDRRLWFSIVNKIRDLVVAVEQSTDAFDIWSSPDVLMTVSENLFSLCALLLRFMLTVGKLESYISRLKADNGFSLFVQAIKPMNVESMLDCDPPSFSMPDCDPPSFVPPPPPALTINPDNALISLHQSPPSPIHPILEGMETSMLSTAGISSTRESRPFDEISDTFSNALSLDSSKIDLNDSRKAAIRAKLRSLESNASINRSVLDLIGIASKNCKTLKECLLDPKLSHDNTYLERISQCAVAIVMACSRLDAELDNILERMRSIDCPEHSQAKVKKIKLVVDKATNSLEVSLKNWSAMISPSSHAKKMADNVSLFEKHLSKVKEVLSDVPVEAYPPKSPERPPTPTDSERDDRTSVTEIDLLLEQEDEAFKNSGEISFRDEGKQVKGATLEKLVEILTYHKLTSTDFSSAFLYTYKSFVTDKELMVLLIKRYNCEAPQHLDEKLKSLYYVKKIIPTRLRVFNFIKMWCKSSQIDIRGNKELMDLLTDFLPTVRADFYNGASEFQSYLERKSNSPAPLISERYSQPINPPTPIVPKSLEFLDIMSIDPLEMARQITILQWNLFTVIQPSECLNQAWNKPDLHHLSPNIRAMIKFSNFLVQWVSTEIVSLRNVRSRALVIKHFIVIADKLKSLNNFDGLKSILCGLQASGVRRLRNSWDLVPAKFDLILDDLLHLMSEEKSCKAYRTALHSVNPPCIPFLGIYLTDLTMIESGNADFLRENKDLINFHKRYLTSQVIQEITRFQHAAYDLEPVEEIASWLTSREVKDVQQVYEISLELEPREAATSGGKTFKQ